MTVSTDPTTRQLHFVTGKGGVGKSVVACALAAGFVARGRRTLLAQVHARDSHAALLGIPLVDEKVREERTGALWVVNITPAAATREYALMTLKFETLYRAVFENKLTKAFLRFVPSLAELTMMGKLWFHAEEKDEDGRPRFDHIVVDLPATGHALKLLQVARVLTQTVRVGPMADKTRLMMECFRDPRRTVTHVVTIPEELPVNESLELLAHLEKLDVTPPGHVVLNQRLPPLFDEALARALPALDGHADIEALGREGRRRLLREQTEAAQRKRLVDSGRTLSEVPMFFDGPLGPGHVTRIADVLFADGNGARR